MSDTSIIVFGACPPGTIYRERPAAYAVICRADGCVAAVSADVRGLEELWLPGGGMQAGETPAETVVREVREELGREVNVGRKLGEAIQFFYAGDRQCWYKMTAHFFAAEFLGEALSQGEHVLLWVDPIDRKTDFFHACHAWAALQLADQ